MAMRVRGRGDVHEVSFVKCHAPAPPSPPGPPPSPRPYAPPAWWLVSPPPPTAEGADGGGGGDGGASGVHASGGGGGGGGGGGFVHDVAAEVRHLINSGMGFVIVVLVVGAALLCGILVRKKHERAKELAEREASLGAVKGARAMRGGAAAARHGVRHGGPGSSSSAAASGCSGRGGRRDAEVAQQQGSKSRSARGSRDKEQSRAVAPAKPSRGPQRNERRGATRVPVNEAEADAWVRDDDEEEEGGGGASSGANGGTSCALMPQTSGSEQELLVEAEEEEITMA